MLYCAFVNTFQALEAPFFACEHDLQVPGHCWLNGMPPPPEEFVAKKNINYHKDMMVRKGVVREDDETLLASNLPPPSKLAAHPNVTCCDALTFDPSPPLEEEDEYSVAALDLSEGARKQLRHACQHWPQAVSTALWPYALRHAAYLDNVLLTLEGGQSKLKLFSLI